jgi:hypothetical protein
MKCVKNMKTEEITRVPDAEAHAMVASGDWGYISRADWKAAGRPDAGPARQTAATRRRARPKPAQATTEDTDEFAWLP